MSRQIDLTKKLSAKDRTYLENRGEYVAIQRNDRQFGAEAATGGSGSSEGTPKPEGAEKAASGATEAPEGPKKFTDEWYDSATVAQLQDELRARNLPVSGKRDELADRLFEAVENEEETS